MEGRYDMGTNTLRKVKDKDYLKEEKTTKIILNVVLGYVTQVT